MPPTEIIDGEEVEMSCEEYAALWGCDPMYDHAPRLPGDGYLFYNFSVEGKDKAFLDKFLPAIERTIDEVKARVAIKASQRRSGCLTAFAYTDEEQQRDIEGLTELETEIKRRLKDVK
jgi:hypothetical protein